MSIVNSACTGVPNSPRSLPKSGSLPCPADDRTSVRRAGYWRPGKVWSQRRRQRAMAIPPGTPGLFFEDVPRPVCRSRINYGRVDESVLCCRQMRLGSSSHAELPVSHAPPTPRSGMLDAVGRGVWSRGCTTCRHKTTEQTPFRCSRSRAPRPARRKVRSFASVSHPGSGRLLAEHSFRHVLLLPAHTRHPRGKSELSS